MLFKNKSNDKIKESIEISKLMKEYEDCKNQFGEENLKTSYLKKRISLQKAVENAKNQMSRAEFHSSTMEYADAFEEMLSTSNVDKKFQNFKHKVMKVSSKLFAEDYTTVDIICATSLFMYLIDTKIYDNHFKNEHANTIFQEVGNFSTGESMANSSFDSEVGFYEVFRMLLDYGFDITTDLEYSRISSYGEKNLIEVVNIEDVQVIPYHLFNNNCKHFKKSLNAEDNQLSNSTFIDFSESIPKVQKRVLNAVSEFWNIEKILKKIGLNEFRQTNTLKQLHITIDKYLVRNMTDYKNPILNINERYISVRKLLEYILLKNNVNYNLYQDLLYENQYYLKIEYDDDTTVKYTSYNILNEDFTLKEIEDYVSKNAFEDDKSSETTSISQENDSEQINENSIITSELEENTEQNNFVPDDSYDVMLQILEHKNAEKNKNNNLKIENDNNNFEEFSQTNPIDFSKAKEEENLLDSMKIETQNDIPNFTFDDDNDKNLEFDDNLKDKQDTNPNDETLDYDDAWIEKELQNLENENLDNSFNEDMSGVFEAQSNNNENNPNEENDDSTTFLNIDNNNDSFDTKTINNEYTNNENYEVDNQTDKKKLNEEEIYTISNKNDFKELIKNQEDLSNKIIKNQNDEEMLDIEDVINYGKPHDKSPDILEENEEFNEKNQFFTQNDYEENSNINNQDFGNNNQKVFNETKKESLYEDHIIYDNDSYNKEQKEPISSPFNESLSKSNLEPKYNPYNSEEFTRSMENNKIIYPDFAKLPSTRSVIEEKNAEIQRLENEISKLENKISQINLQDKLDSLQTQKDELIENNLQQDSFENFEYENNNNSIDNLNTTDALQENNEQNIENSLIAEENTITNTTEENIESTEENTNNYSNVNEENNNDKKEEKKIIANINQLILPPIPPRKKKIDAQNDNSNNNVFKQSTKKSNQTNKTTKDGSKTNKVVTPQKKATSFMPPIPPRKNK